MTKETSRSAACLRELWFSLFDESIITCEDSDDDFQGLLMLFEIALAKTKHLSSSNRILRSSNEKVLSELDWKTQECNKLKIEIQRLENISCQKCSTLEAEMTYFKKKATEAQNRMKSIANILKLGENIQDSQSPRKNSAFTLVSQMLLEESPKRKKRCISKTTLQKETEAPMVTEVHDCETVIPETLPPLDTEMLQAKSIRKHERTEIITSPGDSPIMMTPKNTSLKPSLSINFPLPKKSPSKVRQNLSSKFQEPKSTPPKASSSKLNKEGDKNTSIDLDGSLVGYVKEANSELDRIWFSAGSSRSNDSACEKESSPKEGILDDTPDRSPRVKKAVWKMKEKRGTSERVGNKKLRQMTLSVKQKQKANDVDLSTLSGYDGGSLDKSNKNISSTENRSPLKVRNPVEVPEEIDLGVDTEAFKPKATSTQIVHIGIPKKNEDSPQYAYKRETVRKKSERAKMDGWDCSNCAEYYGALGVSSPSKLKGRMNKCSRHRDKFNPKTNTPPGYWDPIFPDTEQCKELYVSLHSKK